MEMICFNCKITKEIKEEDLKEDPFKKYCDECAKPLGYLVKSRG
jgi:hypothetical protein